MQLAKMIVEEVLEDLTDRKGIGDELDDLAADVLRDLKATLVKKVQRVLDRGVI